VWEGRRGRRGLKERCEGVLPTMPHYPGFQKAKIVPREIRKEGTGVS